MRDSISSACGELAYEQLLCSAILFCRKNESLSPKIFENFCLLFVHSLKVRCHFRLRFTNPALLKLTTQIKAWRVFRVKIIFLRFKDALAYCNASVVRSCKFKSRRIGSWKGCCDNKKEKLK
jgi:hypothetical protein